ncbi:SLAM family member 6-like isoform X2 [Danio aesculapii]|uniref:SLAM family member 6-like isoform X2 n=1 Tax=Danio aesculapii TaxID=1142201 RepID=UPI0024C0AB44|nr:SLAM family member 6-like isoform X2 [Danio aesculapii]
MLKIIISKATLCLFLSLIRGVFGANTDEVKSISVTERDSVTLNTDVTEILKTDQILWMFGPQETRIAEIHKQSIDMFDSNETFGDRLKMDRQTGSLTITDIRNEHSGLYKLTIISSRETSYKRFTVTVYALPVPVISSNYSNSSSSSSSVSSCSVLCSVLNVSAVSLSWYKGNSVLSSISVSDLSISLSLPLEVEYQDKNTYSCVVNNTITNHTTHLDTEQLCQTSRASQAAIFLPVISALVLAGLAAAMYFLYKKHKGKKHKGKKVDGSKASTQRLTTAQTEQTEDVEIQYAEATFHPQNKPQNKANGTEEIIYSSVNMVT